MNQQTTQLPFVSILLPARNEEATIERCLFSLCRQDYPPESMEILVGNDQSTDQTAAKVKAFMGQHPVVTLYNITENIGLAQGKANVLAQLAQQAKGKWLLFTDADMALPQGWARSMVSHAEKEQLDLLTGFTLVEGNSIFQQLQNTEWAMALSLIKLSHDAGFPVTAMGNNMLIRADFYRQIGGYENIPFSITEDYALFERSRQAGGKTGHLIGPEITGFTLPVDRFTGLLQQRKRWMFGAMQLPVFYRLVYGLQFLFLPVLLLTAGQDPWLAIIAFLLKYLLTTGSLIKTFRQAKAPLPWKGIFLFEFYQDVTPWIFLPFYYWPGATLWKGRSY